MEGNERIGILQTNPKPILRESVFGRMHQFAARLYGTVFSYSLQSVHMGHASYIGHNAMIRMRPFIQHCILPELSGSAPWGGKPLSHDIIESALMARAGYEVWFLPEIEGSYEEVPSNILGFLIRERRWMQGNLQHLRFLLLHGLSASYRETFLNGALGYMASPLWAAFLIVSAYGIIHFLRHGVIGLSSFGTIELPMTMLLVSSTVFLFMPRILAILLNVHGKHAEHYGGKDKLLCSLLIETIFSLFFSPIIMVFITRFFWLWAKRKTISWGTQQRDDVPLLWRDCYRHFGWVSGIGLVCWVLISMEVLHVSAERMITLETLSGGWVTPANLLLWFLPVLAGLTSSVVIARITSLTVPALRRWRLFCTPEEIEPPSVVTDTITWERFFCKALPQIEQPAEVLAFAVTDADFYVSHRPETRQRPAVAAWLLPKVRSGQKLTERETLLALSERTCFDAMLVQHLVAKSVRQKPSAAEAA
jgi:membrane glycosyltransferase